MSNTITPEFVLDVGPVIATNNSLIVSDQERIKITQTLTEANQQLPVLLAKAQALVIHTPEDYEVAAGVRKSVRAVSKAAVEVLEDHCKNAQLVHRGWTGLRNLFTKPADQIDEILQKKQEQFIREEERRAAEKQARLQREAEEKARKERERAEAAARAQREKEEAARRAEEAAKRAELEAQRAAEEALRKAAEAENAALRKKLEAEAEKRRQEAEAQKKAAAAQAAVAEKARLAAEAKDEKAANAIAAPAPVVTAEIPKVAGSSQRRPWVVKSFNMDQMGIPKTLWGFVEVNTTALAKSKNANPFFELPGVVFEQQIRVTSGSK